MILSFRREAHLKPSGLKVTMGSFAPSKTMGMLNKYIGTSKLNEIPCIRSYQSSLQRLQNRTKIERVSCRALSCLLSTFIVDNNQTFNSIQFNSIQFNSIQFNSIQFNSIQFNSIQKKYSICSWAKCFIQV